MLRLLARSPWLPVLLVALVMVVGGILNGETARGVIVADANGLPVAPRDVFFGARHYAVGADGVFNAPNLPRGAKLTIIAQGFGRVDAPATTSEVRLVAAIITFNVADADTGAPVKNPEARVKDKVVGKGTESGVMVVAPAPAKGEQIVICAAGYENAFTETALPDTGIRLKKGTTGCPDAPGPAPTENPNAP